MTIKYLVHNFTSRTDTYGNRYTKTQITRTSDGAQITLDTGWGGPNLQGYRIYGCVDHSEVMHTDTELPIREWKRIPAKPLTRTIRECGTIEELLDAEANQ